MYNLLSLPIVFSLFFPIVFADLQTCNGFREINHPTNLSESYYWPNGWTILQNSVPQFASGQNCSWKFNVPKGMYAYFGAEFTSYDSKTLLKVTNSLGKTVILGNSSTEYPYFLVDPGFSVELDSFSVGYLGIRVAWFPIPETNPISFSVMPSDPPLVLNGDTFNNVTTVRTLKRVSLVSIKPQQADNNDVPTMRLTLVFDGPTTNSQFLGTLWDVFMSDNQLISSGPEITLLTVWPGTNLGNIAIFQDYTRLQNFTSFKGINCYLNYACKFTLDGRNGPAAAIRYYESPHYLTSYDFSQNSQLSVYSGIIDQNHLLANYQKSFKDSLPQQFRSVLTIYTLNENMGNFEINGTQFQTGWNKMRNGRTGMIASKNFGTLSADQEFSETFTSDKFSLIQLLFRNSGLTGQASLRVTVLQGQKTVADETYNSANLPSTSKNYTGNKMTIEYMTKGVSTTGCHVDFSFQNSSNSLTILTSFLMVIIFKLF